MAVNGKNIMKLRYSEVSSWKFLLVNCKVKNNNNMINNVNSRRHVDSEKSEPQMGFEPTTLRDLVGCSTTELLDLTLAHHRVSSSSVVEHPTRSRRVVGSNPIWGSDFSESTCLLEFTLFIK